MYKCPRPTFLVDAERSAADARANFRFPAKD
jgi:hypothetical protein